MPRARADLGPVHTCPRGLNLVLPRGQGLTSACCEETVWLEIAASFAAFVCRQAHFPHGKWILNSPSGFDASAGRSGSLIGMVSVRNSYAPADTGSNLYVPWTRALVEDTKVPCINQCPDRIAKVLTLP